MLRPSRLRYLAPNDLTFPSDAAGRRTIRTLEQRTGSTGLPPVSCAAFGQNAQQSAANPNICVECDDSAVGTLVLLLCVTAVVLALFAAYIRLVIRHPDALSRWVSTATIIVQHAQVASLVLATVPLTLPPAFRKLLAVISLNLLRLANLSCLNGSGTHAGSLFPIIYCSFMLLLLLGLLLSQSVAARFGRRKRWRQQTADGLEFVLSLIFSTQLIVSTSVCAGVIVALSLMKRPRFAYLYLQFESTYYTQQFESSRQALLIASAFAATLALLQLALLLRFATGVGAYHAGVSRGDWRLFRCDGLWRYPPARHCSSTRIAPRRLERRVGFLVRRYAAHAPRWQLVVWCRNLTLLAIATVSGAAEAEGGWLVLAVCAMLVTIAFFWAWHYRTQPYAFRYQNAVESWLLASLVILLLLASVYSVVVHFVRDGSAASSGVQTAFAVLMLLVLFGALLAASLLSVRDYRAARKEIQTLDLSAMLLKADGRLDDPLRAALADGTIRLLRCSWLAAADLPVLARRQDLPDEAFVPPDEAVAMLAAGNRSILALSYGWQTPSHPDPFGTTLAAVRRFLATESADALATSALFWDFASLPQKDPACFDSTETLEAKADEAERSAFLADLKAKRKVYGGKAWEESRTPEARSIFDKGLKLMKNVYASITGTCVLQQKDVPARPAALADDVCYNDRACTLPRFVLLVVWFGYGRP